MTAKTLGDDYAELRKWLLRWKGHLFDEGRYDGGAVIEGFPIPEKVLSPALCAEFDAKYAKFNARLEEYMRVVRTLMAIGESREEWLCSGCDRLVPPEHQTLWSLTLTCPGCAR